MIYDIYKVEKTVNGMFGVSFYGGLKEILQEGFNLFINIAVNVKIDNSVRWLTGLRKTKYILVVISHQTFMVRPITI